MKDGERIYRVTCTKEAVCHECLGTILIGKPMLIDKIPYGGHTHNHLLHPEHFKGNPKHIVDLTMKPHRGRRKGRSYEEKHRKNY